MTREIPLPLLPHEARAGAALRRVVRPIVFRQFGPSDTPGYDWTFRGTRNGGTRGSTSHFWQDYRHAEFVERCCPLGGPGTVLWGREAFWCSNDSDGDDYGSWDCGSNLTLGPEYAQIQYCAAPECRNPPTCKGQETVGPHTGDAVPGDWWLSPPDDWNGVDDYHGRGEWIFLPWGYFTKHSSAQMPRWASRLAYRVQAVSVVRLQALTEADAQAAGMQCFLKDGKLQKWWPCDPCDGPLKCAWADLPKTAREAFRVAWGARWAGKGLGWSSDCWVWSVAVEALERRER